MWQEKKKKKKKSGVRQPQRSLSLATFLSESAACHETLSRQPKAVMVVLCKATHLEGDQRIAELQQQGPAAYLPFWEGVIVPSTQDELSAPSISSSEVVFLRVNDAYTKEWLWSLMSDLLTAIANHHEEEPDPLCLLFSFLSYCSSFASTCLHPGYTALNESSSSSCSSDACCSCSSSSCSSCSSCSSSSCSSSSSSSSSSPSAAAAAAAAGDSLWPANTFQVTTNNIYPSAFCTTNQTHVIFLHANRDVHTRLYTDLHWNELIGRLLTIYRLALQETAVCSTLGGAYASIKNAERAFLFAQRQLSLAKVLGDVVMEIRSEVYIAYYYMNCQLFNKAETHLQHQMQRARDMRNSILETMITAALSHLDRLRAKAREDNNPTPKQINHF
ncbi:putative regulator of nonsense transcripts protein 1 [Balamuthia mandrillaris]